MDFPGGSVGKDSAYDARYTGDACLIPQLGRSPGGRHDNPLQYSCLGNPMDRGAWWATVRGVAKESNKIESLSTYTHCAIQRALLFIRSLCHSLPLLTPNSDPLLPLGLANHTSALCLWVHFWVNDSFHITLSHGSHNGYISLRTRALIFFLKVLNHIIISTKVLLCRMQ